jgi:HK97 family phage major capsid protein
MDTKQLNEQRLGIIAKQREMNDKVIAEGRDFTAEENDAYGKMEAEANGIKARVDRVVTLEAAEKELTSPTRQGVRPALDAKGKPLGPRATAEYEENFRAWMKYGDASTPSKILATLQKSSSGTGGGNYLVPLDYETDYLKKLTNANIIRQLATVRTTSKDGVIPIQTGLPTFAWIDELGTFPKTQGAYGPASYGAWKLGGIIQISEELLDDAEIDMASAIADDGATAEGLTEEASFIVGDGNKKPQGIVTTTGVNNVTSAAPTTIGFDDILAMIHATPRYYRANGVFVFADTAVLSLRKAKATTGEYLWQPSTQAGAPDLLYGKPFYTSDFLATVAATSVSGFFGDVRQYRVLDRRGLSLQRLNELYAESGQIGFRMWRRLDGKLLRPDAITLLTQHA